MTTEGKMMNVFLEILQLIGMSLLQLVALLGVLIGSGLLLGLLEKLSNSLLVRALGMRGVLLTAWLGTPVHELGHLLMCFIWGHRVTSVRLLRLNRQDGVLGYVQHEYNPNSMYQQAGNFFIGIGPLFSGIGALLVGMYYFVPQAFVAFKAEVEQQVLLQTLNFNVFKIVVEAAASIGKSFFSVENILQPSFWLFLLIALSISSHMALSRADIHNSANGLVTIFIALFLFNLFGKIFHIDSAGLVGKIAEYNAYLLAFASVAIFFSLVTLSISAVIYGISVLWRKNRVRHP